jgi:hypothetical protein
MSLLPQRDPCWHTQDEIDLGNEAFYLLVQLWEARHRPILDTGSPTNPLYREFLRDYDHIMRESTKRMQRMIAGWGKVR